MSNQKSPSEAPDIARTRWWIDPERSRVEFHVRHFWGLMTVKGHFEHYAGFLDLGSVPAVDLTIEATTLDTGNAKRDAHLRSDDFFDVETHPQVRFTADRADLDGELLHAVGRLEAAGRSVPLEVDTTLHRRGEELEVNATATVDHRELGMTWSPLGMLRSPSRLVVEGRLVRDA